MAEGADTEIDTSVTDTAAGIHPGVVSGVVMEEDLGVQVATEEGMAGAPMEVVDTGAVLTAVVVDTVAVVVGTGEGVVGTGAEDSGEVTTGAPAAMAGHLRWIDVAVKVRRWEGAREIGPVGSRPPDVVPCMSQVAFLS